MIKQHLSIFAIVAISLIMGMPVLMVEAERPATNIDDTFPPETVNVGVYPNTVCGFEDVAGTAVITKVVTTYQNGNQNKVVTEITWIGELFADSGAGEKVATLNDKTTTTADNSDKGNSIDKKKAKLTIDCLDGGKEVNVEVTITNS